MSEGRRRQRSQLKQRANPSFLHLFVLFRPPVDWKRPIDWCGPSLLSPPIQMLFSSGNSLAETTRNNVLLAMWASLKIKSTITATL